MWIMMQYKIKPEYREEYLALHAAVYEELEQHRPEGLREVTFKAGAENTFVAIVQADDMPVPGTEHLPAMQEYRKRIDEFCDGPVVKTLLQKSGSYQLA